MKTAELWPCPVQHQQQPQQQQQQQQQQQVETLVYWKSAAGRIG
jgi:hypothetical protein